MGWQDAPVVGGKAWESAPVVSGAPSTAENLAAITAGAQTPGDAASSVAAQRAQQPAPEPTLMERAIGAGEAALTTGTGIVGGTFGGAVGLLQGIANELRTGAIGSREAADRVEQKAAEYAQALTYAPRTEQGQQQAGVIGDVMQQILPAAAVMPSLPVAQTARPIAMSTAQATLNKAATAIPAAIERVQQAARPKTPGTLGSVGAAGTDVALQRRVAAESLPVPVRLTKGQAERSFEQQRFEQEIAKDPTLGAPLRERMAEQNVAVPQNFEAWIDQTGAKAATPIDVGRAVIDEALVKDAAKAKAKYRVKYREAEKAGEMADPADIGPVLAYLDENESLNAPELAGGSLGLARREIQRLSADGQTLSLKDMELLRRQIGNAIDANPTNITNMRAGVRLREIIDQQTEGLGGDIYKEARAARRRYAQLYEDNAIVRDLLATRRGTSDRQVALENVFRRTILNGTREDLSKLRRTLQLPKSEEGMQAWRELQGQTLRHIIDESTAGVATDMRGNPIVSAAKMNSIVRSLDQGGKLDFVLGRKGAQQIRDMNELVKVIYTSPPGAVNTSNTASVILAAIAEAGATGAISGLPIPAISTVRLLTKYVKDRAVRQRIMQALGEAEQKAKTQPKRQDGATVH